MQTLPDALIIPARLKTGDRIFDRVYSICRIAEPLLGVDYPGGERAYICTMDNGLFVTKSPKNTINFPSSHRLSSRPRYTWIKSEDGIWRGYLKPEAILAAQ